MTSFTAQLPPWSPFTGGAVRRASKASNAWVSPIATRVLTASKSAVEWSRPGWWNPPCANAVPAKSRAPHKLNCIFFSHYKIGWFVSRQYLMVNAFPHIAKLSLIAAGVVTTLLLPCGCQNCPASQGDEPRRGGGGLTPTGTTPDASADNINGSEKEESHSCAWETPPALRATSPARRRSFIFGRTNSLLRLISNLS